MKSSIDLVLSLFALVLSSIPVVKANERPRNTLTKYGQPTILSCCSSQANAGLYWRFRKWDASDAEKVCDKDTWREGYSRVTNDTCLNLIILSTTPKFAGLYQCVEPGGITTGGYVSVYDNFACDVNVSEIQDLVEGDDVLFNCSIFCVGSLSVELQWATTEPVHKTTFPKQPQDHIYTSFLKIVAKRTSLQPLTVTVVLDEKTSDENIDKRFPNTSTTLKTYPVMYPVSNIRTSCAHESNCEKEIGDSIICAADGHPIPEFQWLNWDGKLESDGPVLNIAVRGSQRFNCVATNSIRGKVNKLSIQIVVNAIVPKASADATQETFSNFDGIIRYTYYPLLVVVCCIVLWLTKGFVYERRLRSKAAERGKPDVKMEDFAQHFLKSPVDAKDDSTDEAEVKEGDVQSGGIAYQVVDE